MQSEWLQRSIIERFIADMQNGFELRHLPCQSLNANRAYALIEPHSRSDFSPRVFALFVFGELCQNRIRRTLHVPNTPSAHQTATCIATILAAQKPAGKGTPRDQSHVQLPRHRQMNSLQVARDQRIFACFRQACETPAA